MHFLTSECISLAEKIMREIKFRAWDKKLGGMFKGLPVSSAAAIVVADRSVDLLRNFRSEDEQWIVMQFTGLKDKNGKDLFEGDNLYVVDEVVVETIGGYPRTEPEGRTETIKYERGAFWWGEELLWEVAEHGEVISNIYESETR